jgi:hypothetical protein
MGLTGSAWNRNGLHWQGEQELREIFTSQGLAERGIFTNFLEVGGLEETFELDRASFLRSLLRVHPREAVVQRPFEVRRRGKKKTREKVSAAR